MKILYLALLLLLLLLSLCHAALKVEALKVEAVIEDYVVGAGKDGSDQLKTHYSNETLANMGSIMKTRVHDLVNTYCPHLVRELALFAVEHGPVFGVTNETVPNFDHYDVGQRVLMVLEAIDGFPVLSEAALNCRDMVGKQHGSTSKRQHALWIVACIWERQEKERDTRPGDEVFLRWVANVDVSVAMHTLGHILRCPQFMTKLAAYQVDVEYRRDALVKAGEAGKLSKERLSAALAKFPLPRRVDYQRALFVTRNATLSAEALARSKPLATSICTVPPERSFESMTTPCAKKE